MTTSTSIAPISSFKLTMRAETAARKELELLFSEQKAKTGDKFTLSYDSHKLEHVLLFNGWPCHAIKNRFKRLTDALSYIKPYFTCN